MSLPEESGPAAGAPAARDVKRLKSALRLLEGGAQAHDGPERYLSVDGRLVRRVLLANGTVVDTDFGAAPASIKDPAKLHARADQRYLRARERPGLSRSLGSPVRVADLFSGLGSLTLGVFEAARAVGRPAELALAVDLEQPALDVLTKALGADSGSAVQADLGRSLAGDGPELTADERALLASCPGDVDVLVAGPPCQGHSRLNNHTRHDDPRNELYACVARFAELRNPSLCVIENVDSVVHDQRQAAASVAERLRGLGYEVQEGTVALHQLGVAQARRRHVLVAVRAGRAEFQVETVLARYAVENPELRTVKWAIGDLAGSEGLRTYDQASVPTDTNLERMQWLHSEDEYDLPDDQRPDCHRLPKEDENGVQRSHSYRSMYGRMRWDKPAQTITSGYGSMGQGRYVHPLHPRTLTPHEAARLQFIPDFVRPDSATTRRGDWARMIGNVAPMKLSYVFALEFLRQQAR